MKKPIVIIAFALVLIAGIFCKKEVEAPYEAKDHIFVTGSPIHGANGLMFDGQDRLHIASAMGREIIVMDPDTGEILERLGTDKGVDWPDDLAFGPDGSLYWTAISTGEIGRLSPDGAKTGQLVAQGVNPITFSDDGRLFTALDFYGDALYELDPELKDPPRLLAENLGWLNGFDIGPDGFLYGPIITQGWVARVDVNTDEPAIETAISGFPTGAVKFDSKGLLHAVNAMSGDVTRIDLKTGDREVIATVSHSVVDNLAFDSHDRLFVSDAADGTITEVLIEDDDTGNKTRIVSKGGMIGPGGISIIPRPGGEISVFVADVWMLREFNGQTGKQVSSVCEAFNPSGGLTAPLTVSSDGEDLVVSSWLLSQHVQVWNPEKREVLINLDFAGPPPSAVPINAIRFQGELVIADLLSASVFKVADGNADERDTLADGLKVPVGLAVTDDDLWVSDWATGNVWQIVADGNPVSPMKLVATGLKFPEGLAVDLDESLLVVETGTGNLLRLNPDTGDIDVVAVGLSLNAEALSGEMPPNGVFNGVAVDQSGTIYVTGDATNVLYRFKPRR